MQSKELKAHIKKQNIQIKQLEASAQQAAEATQKAEQQYTEHLQQLQSQLEQAQHHTATASDGTQLSDAAEPNSPLQAEIEKLTQQLAEAQEHIHHLQQQQAEAGSANPSQDLPSNPTTPSKPGPVSAAQDSAVQDSGNAASAEKDSAKDKDTQLQEYKQRLLKAKKYIQNLKQQAADATAAKEQALTDLQAVQQQLNEEKSDGVAGDQSEGDAVPRAEHERVKVSTAQRHHMHSTALMFMLLHTAATLAHLEPSRSMHFVVGYIYTCICTCTVCHSIPTRQKLVALRFCMSLHALFPLANVKHALNFSLRCRSSFVSRHNRTNHLTSFSGCIRFSWRQKDTNCQSFKNNTMWLSVSIKQQWHM